ncbi:MAG: hypothetical protein RLZZ450_2574 [Pseudomonadota bacterium]|jgi:hypothetical protein
MHKKMETNMKIKSNVKGGKASVLPRTGGCRGPIVLPLAQIQIALV